MRQRLALDVAREPRAEQRVDHAGRAVEGDLGRGARFAVEPRGGGRGVARERIAPAEEAERDGKAALAEEPGRDEAVAAVVARTAEHDDASARRRETLSLAGDREPGPLHQRHSWRSARDRQPIGCAHLARGQQFREFERIEHGFRKWRSGFGAASGKIALSIVTNSAISRSADPR